jgi:transcription antitermination factor NusG
MAVARLDLIRNEAAPRLPSGFDGAVSQGNYPTSCGDQKSLDWYALCVRPRYEKLATMMLTNKGYETLLPLYKCRRRRPDRYKEIQLPMFPGYLFCQFHPDARLPILTTPGVLHVVGSGRVPIPIHRAEMEAVRHLAESQLRAEPHPYLEVGQKVYIQEGPLVGTVGILLAKKNSHRVIISVTLLRRSVCVEIDRDWARPEPSGLAPARHY